MPPRGVKKGTKRARQYEQDQAEPEAARYLGAPRRGDRREDRQKESARAGESRQRSRTSTQDISSGRRGGQRSGSGGPGGPDPRAALQPGQEAEHRRALAR